MSNTQKPIYRAQMAKLAGITPVQLDYLVRLGIVAPDIGGARKRYSDVEMRLTVIAGELLKFYKDARSLKDPMDRLRKMIEWPGQNRPIDWDHMRAEQSLEDYRWWRSKVEKSAAEGNELAINSLPAIKRKGDFVKELFEEVGAPIGDEELNRVGSNWTDDQIDRAEFAWRLAATSQDAANLYLQTNINKLPLEWEWSSEPTSLDGAETILTINVRSLFRRACERAAA